MNTPKTTTIKTSGSEKPLKIWRVDDGKITMTIIKSNKRNTIIRIEDHVEFAMAIIDNMSEEELEQIKNHIK